MRKFILAAALVFALLVPISTAWAQRMSNFGGTTNATWRIGNGANQVILADGGGVGESGTLNVSGLTLSGTFTTTGAVVFGADGAGVDFTLYTDVATEEFLWDASENGLFLDGTNGVDVLTLLDGDLNASDAGTFGGLLTGTLGFTMTGAAVNLNASSNFGVNIATGTSTGAVVIGNGAAGAASWTSGGGIVVTSAAASTITNSVGDYTLDSAAGSLNLRSGESAVDSIVISADLGGIDITTAAAAAGEDIDITANGSSINLISDEVAALQIVLDAQGLIAGTALDITTTDGGIDLDANGAANGDIVINSADATTVDATGTISLDSGAASNFSTSAGDLTFDAAAGSANLTAGENANDSIVISSDIGGIDITCVAAGAGEDIDLTASGSSVNVVATEAAALQIVLDAQGVAAGIGINITTTDSSIDLDANGGVNGDININAADILSLDATDGISIDAGTASNLTCAVGDLSLAATTGSVNIDANEAAADQIDLSAAGTIAGNAINVNTADGGILLNAGGAGNGDVNLTAANDYQLTVVGTANHGTATCDDHIFLSDGTGTAEFQLVAGSIDGTEILDATIAAADLSNSLCLQVVSGEFNPTEAGATNDYLNFVDNTFSATESAENMWAAPIAGVLSNLFAEIDVAAGAGNDSWTITIRDDGGGTIVTCDIDEAATSCTDVANTVAISAGENITVEVDSSGGAADPDAAAVLSISFCWSQ